MLRRILAALVRPAAAIVIAGCTSLPTPPAERIHSGRFAATVISGDRQENAAGRFLLAVRSDGVTLDLASPLGNTLARVHTDAGGATLTAPQPDGTLATVSGASAEALAEQALGWRLPMAGIADWIRGRPAAGQAAILSSANGLASRIEQDGWTIAIVERFEDSGAPRRLTFERAATAATPAVLLRLLLDSPVASTTDAAAR